jgi:hypothetical protein
VDLKAGRKLQRNFLAVLYTLDNSTSDALVNVSLAAHSLLTDIIEEGFGVLEALAYVPQILALDGEYFILFFHSLPNVCYRALILVLILILLITNYSTRSIYQYPQDHWQTFICG